MSTPSSDGTRPVRVFVSYDTQSEACSSFAHWLAYELCEDGIDAWAAIFVHNPEEGWVAWRERQVREADVVLLVCNERTCQCFDQPGGAGGVQIQQEATLLRDRFAANPCRLSWAIPVLPRGLTPAHAPGLFRSNAFPLNDKPGYDRLCRIITGQPVAQRPPLGRSPRRTSNAPPRSPFEDAPRAKHDHGKPPPGPAVSAVRRRSPRAVFDSILRKPPRDGLQVLAEHLGQDFEPPDLPARLAAEIDGLRGDISSTRRLVLACEVTLAWFENAQPEDARMELDNLRALLAAWLPRCRVGRCKGELWEYLPPAEPRPADACDDLVLHTNNLVFADIRVAHEDEIPVDLQCKKDGRIEGRRSMPVSSAHGAGLHDDREIAEYVADGYASQFPGAGQHDGTREGHRRFARGRLARLRTRRHNPDPRYVPCRPGDIPEGALIHLKRIYPPLRFVLLNGHIDDDEQEILQILFDIFSDDPSH